MTTNFRHDWPPIPDPAQQTSQFWAGVWDTVRAELLKQPYKQPPLQLVQPAKPDASDPAGETSWNR